MTTTNSRTRRRVLATLAMITAMVGSTTAATANEETDGRTAQPPPVVAADPARDALQRSAGPEAVVSTHARTGKVRFVGAAPDRTIDARVSPGTTPQVGARAFLDRHAAAFGIGDPATEVREVATSDLRGRRAEPATSVRYEQLHRGVPVFGGQVTVQLDADNRVLSAMAELLPDLSIDVDPTVSREEATATAVARTARAQDVAGDALTATTPELVVYNPVVLGGPAGAHQGLDATFLAWRTEVRSDQAAVRRLVLVDARRNGTVLLDFDQVTTAKDRIVCDNQNTSGEPYGCPSGVNPVVRSEGGPASAVPDVNLAYDYAGDTYDFFFDHFGRDSLDDAGMPLVSTVRHCPSGAPCPFANAFWDGEQMVYGEGFAAADDVVGHELTHGVTEFTNGLFYYYQSGAINEALSDVFGEFVDLANGAGTDGAGVRWLLGEDVPGFGAIRNMAHPPAFGDPDRMLSPNYYAGSGLGAWSGAEDSGGVHTNSGVLNKATYLMTDGGSFNGETVTGLGIDKVALVVYQAAAMLTSGSDYADLYDALRQSCQNLLGTAGITTADCNEVEDALDATEMNLQPAVGTTSQAPVCPAGQDPTSLFFDDMEDPGTGLWTDNDPSWETYVSGYAHSGELGLYRPDHPSTSDYRTSMTASVTVPSGGAYLRFDHAFEFEEGSYDGSVVEYSTNNGSSWTDAGALFTHGGYNGTISDDFDNPLAGRAGFTDVSFGYASARLDLSSLAGQHVRFRFRTGTDLAVGDLGWVIDDVHLYTCAPPPPSLRFVAVEPCAVFDTRSGTGTFAGPLDGGDVVSFTVASDVALPPGQGGEGCAPPPLEAVAVELNLVAAGPSGSGNLRVSESGVTPEGGVVNFSAGFTNASSVPVAVNPNGRIDVAVNATAADVVDVRGVALGYWVDAATDPGGLLFVEQTACDVFDTRAAGGAMAAGESRTFSVAGVFDAPGQGGSGCAAPPAGATGALVNLVAIQPTASGNLRAVAEGGTAAGGVVNFVGGGGNNSNAVPVGLSAGGQIDVTANTPGAVHVRGVVLGYFVDAGHAAAGDGLELVVANACAVFDTRPSTGRVSHGDVLTLAVAGPIPPGQGSAGCVAPPATADAVMLNLVAIGPVGAGNLKLSAAGVTAQGGVVNFDPDRGTNANAVATGVTVGGVDVAVNATVADTAHVRGVTLGWYQAP